MRAHCFMGLRVDFQTLCTDLSTAGVDKSAVCSVSLVSRTFSRISNEPQQTYGVCVKYSKPMTRNPLLKGFRQKYRILQMTDRKQTENALEKSLCITNKEREVLWEASAIDRGRDRYNSTFVTKKISRDGTVKHESAELGDVAPGQLVLKEMMVQALPYFHAAIEEAKAEITALRCAMSMRPI